MKEIEDRPEPARMRGGRAATSGSEPSAAGSDEALLREAWGALNFILAFYEPGQRHLDTEAWKQAEAAGRRAQRNLSERLEIAR